MTQMVGRIAGGRRWRRMQGLCQSLAMETSVAFTSATTSEPMRSCSSSIERVVRHPVRITVAGRTDAGGGDYRMAAGMGRPRRRDLQA